MTYVTLVLIDAVFVPRTQAMTEQTTLMTLPPELRERIYEYVACTHCVRRVRTKYGESSSIPDFKTTTSAISATCRLVNKEYEAVARRFTTTLEFTATNMDFGPIMVYFHRKVDPEFLATLKQNKAMVLVNISIDNQNYYRDIAGFYPWALFLISVELEAAYQSDTHTWMEIHIAKSRAEFEEQCVLDINSPQNIRHNIEKIRKLARDFDEAVWTAYPKFFKEMQVRYGREYNG